MSPPQRATPIFPPTLMPSALEEYLAQRFPGGPGHASFLVFLRNQALALGGDHRPLNDAHHAGEKIAAEIRSRRTNLGFLQFLSALLFFLAALGHGDHDRGPRHFPAPGGKISIHETSLLFWTHGGGKGRLTAAAPIRSAYYTMPWPVCKGSAPPGLHFWRFCGFIRKEKTKKEWRTRGARTRGTKEQFEPFSK